MIRFFRRTCSLEVKFGKFLTGFNRVEVSILIIIPIGFTYINIAMADEWEGNRHSANGDSVLLTADLR